MHTEGKIILRKPPFKKWEFNLYIKYLTYFNIIILSFVNLLKETVNLGMIRAVVLFTAVAWFFSTKRVRSITFNWLMLFSAWILIMGAVTWLRYDYFPDKVLKVFLGSVSFAYGLYFINSPRRFSELNRVFLFSIAIIFFTIVLANITGVSYKLYADTGFSFGGQGVNIAKNLTIFVLPFPIYMLLVRKRGSRLLLRVIYIICLVIIVISMKRGAMLGLLLGTAAYFFTSASRGIFLRNSLIAITVLFLAFPLYEPILQETFIARQQNFSLEEKDVESEGRYMEYKMTVDDIRHKSILRTMTGEGVQSESFYFNILRMHHTDFFSILFGAGVIGLVLYIMTYYKAYAEVRHFRFLERSRPMVREMRAVTNALIFGLAGLSLSGVYHTIDLRVMAFLYIGGCVGVMRSQLPGVILKKQPDDNKTMSHG
jgi:hypothetical protein